jgi:hypothetical protein
MVFIIDDDAAVRDSLRERWQPRTRYFTKPVRALRPRAISSLTGFAYQPRSIPSVFMPSSALEAFSDGFRMLLKIRQLDCIKVLLGPPY